MNPGVLPHNLDAERAALGAAFLEPDTMLVLSGMLEPDDFYTEQHRAIWEAQLALFRRRTPPDLVAVADELRRMGKLEQVGGVPYLVDCSNALSTAYYAEHYAQIVARAAFHRRLIRAGSQIAALGYAQPEDSDKAQADAQALVMASAKATQRRGLLHMRDIADEYLSQLNDALTGKTPPAFKTGWYDIDRLIGGLRRGNLIVLTSPSGTGKSTAMCQLTHLCAKGGGRAGMFSLEMKRHAPYMRMLAQHLFWTKPELNITYDMLRDARFITGQERHQASIGIIGRQDLQKLEDRRVQAVVEASNAYFPSLNLYIDDDPGLTIDQIRLRALRTAAIDGPFDLIAVDYAQLAEASKKHSSREQEVAEIADGLLTMAKELDCPVLALAQQNDEGKVRESRRLFNNCHVELRLSREEINDPETDRKGIADLHVTKARDGMTDRVALKWDGAHQLLLNLVEGLNPEGY